MVAIPAKPKGACVEMNIWGAKSQIGFVLGPMDLAWFFQQVRNRGPWDYKQSGSGYADFGNFNYGAVGYAIGIPEVILLRAAGWAQSRAGTSASVWGTWWGESPYGDDPMDQNMIAAGISYAKLRGY